MTGGTGWKIPPKSPTESVTMFRFMSIYISVHHEHGHEKKMVRFVFLQKKMQIALCRNSWWLQSSVVPQVIHPTFTSRGPGHHNDMIKGWKPWRLHNIPRPLGTPKNRHRNWGGFLDSYPVRAGWCHGKSHLEMDENCTPVDGNPDMAHIHTYPTYSLDKMQ